MKYYQKKTANCYPSIQKQKLILLNKQNNSNKKKIKKKVKDIFLSEKDDILLSEEKFQ